MCSIVDTDVVSALWDDNGIEAGIRFRRWIEGKSEDGNKGLLIVGSALLREYEKTPAARWVGELRRSGRVIVLDEEQNEEVSRIAEKLRQTRACKSNDHTIIALAIVTGARLLYSRDMDLREDFQNSDLLAPSGGKIYSTHKVKAYRKQHRLLLSNRDLCKEA